MKPRTERNEQDALFLGVSLLILCCASVGWSCPKGSEPYRDGVCVSDIKPEGVTATDSSKWVSDEKPPRHPQAAWETGEIKTVDLQNTDVAMRNPPDSCKKKAAELKVTCIWTGVDCVCNEDKNAGKKSR